MGEGFSACSPAGAFACGSQLLGPPDPVRVWSLASWWGSATPGNPTSNTVQSSQYAVMLQVPGPELPAPTAQIWLDMAKLVSLCLLYCYTRPLTYCVLSS
jgi:hypothetical protein